MADQYDPLPDLADLVNASVNMDGVPAAYRLARKLRITPETGAKKIEARLRDALAGLQAGVDAPDGELDLILNLAYACTRVWEAWQYGTMSEADFEPAAETEIRDDLIAWRDAAVRSALEASREPAPVANLAAGDELRVRIHAHLRLHPGLTAFELARVLQLPNPHQGGQATVRRHLVRMEDAGEAVRTVGPKDEGDRRPTARWTAA